MNINIQPFGNPPLLTSSKAEALHLRQSYICCGGWGLQKCPSIVFNHNDTIGEPPYTRHRSEALLLRQSDI